MSSLTAVLKRQQSKPQETRPSIRKGEVTNIVLENPESPPESTEDRVPRALEQILKVQSSIVQK
jgi:hypothetical protein